VPAELQSQGLNPKASEFVPRSFARSLAGSTGPDLGSPPGLNVPPCLDFPPGLEPAEKTCDVDDVDTTDDETTETSNVEEDELDAELDDLKIGVQKRRSWSQILFPDSGELVSVVEKDGDECDSVGEKDMSTTSGPPPGLEDPVQPPGLEDADLESELLVTHALLLQQSALLWEYHQRLANVSGPPGVWTLPTHSVSSASSSSVKDMDGDCDADVVSAVSTGDFSGIGGESSGSSSDGVGSSE